MADATQFILTVGLPTLAVPIGILVNNSRLSDFRGDINRGFENMDRRFDEVERRIDDSRDLLRADFFRVEKSRRARIIHLEENR